MRSGIARILTDRRVPGAKSFYKIYMILPDWHVNRVPRIRLKFLDFPIFLDLGGPRGLRILEEYSKMPRGHGICQNSRPTRPLFSRSYWNSSVLPTKKGDFFTGGRQHLCLIQERKAENEECL